MDEKKSSQPHGAPHGGAKQPQSADAPKQPHAAPAQPGAPKPQGPPQKAASAAPKKDYGENFRGIVRLAGKDLKGEMPLRRAIMRVRGVGERLGAILGDIAITDLKLPNDIVVGLVTEEQMAKLEDMLIHPTKYGVPSFMLNRRMDPTTGEDLQLIGNDVRFYVGQDIDGDKGMNTWRGYRHLYGQKVRGQHTRSTGRTGMTVGVLRKTVLAAKAGAIAAEAGKPGAPGAAPAAGAEGKGAAPKVGAAAVPKGGAGAAAPKAGAPAAGGAKPAAGGAKPEAKKEAPKK
ncbi:MAG: 30S ribosomal protein S13 [Candidatus Micrarchaeia archaeon]|jgi:small subunit ribosomal protein S13